MAPVLPIEEAGTSVGRRFLGSLHRSTSASSYMGLSKIKNNKRREIKKGDTAQIHTVRQRPTPLSPVQ
jgi:hypothetical protein